MEDSFAAQLFKNPLWTRLQGGECRERGLKHLGTLKRWTGITGINHQHRSLWVAPNTVPQARGSRAPPAPLVLQLPALSPGAAPARLFSSAKQKECEIKGVAG